MTSITIGGLHHSAVVVEDAEAMATFHEKAFGWKRMLDMTASTAEEAALWGRVFGIHSAVAFRAIMLEADGTRRDGRVEYVQLTTTDGPGHVVLAGTSVTSFRVGDLDAAAARMTENGARIVLPPTALLLGGWNVKIASLRDPVDGLIELVQMC